MDAAPGAVALDPAPDRGAGEAERPGLADEGLIQRLAVKRVRFTDDDAKQLPLAGDLHVVLTVRVR